MATLVIDSACGTESEELEIGEVHFSFLELSRE